MQKISERTETIWRWESAHGIGADANIETSECDIKLMRKAKYLIEFGDVGCSFNA